MARKTARKSRKRSRRSRRSRRHRGGFSAKGGVAASASEISFEDKPVVEDGAKVDEVAKDAPKQAGGKRKRRRRKSKKRGGGGCGLTDDSMTGGKRKSRKKKGDSAENILAVPVSKKQNHRFLHNSSSF